MRFCALILVCFSGVTCGAQQSFVYTGHGRFYHVFCHSIQAVKPEYFQKHVLPYTIIDTAYLPVKHNHEISIEHNGNSLVFKDDSSKRYFYAGEDFSKNWILICQQETRKSVYYLVHQNSLKMDTLIGYPQVTGNRIVCLESRLAGDGGDIEVWDIHGTELELRTKFSVGKCQLDPIRIAVSDANELLFQVRDNSYFKIDLPAD